ncbi:MULTISPECIES: glutathione S-transferase family protein [unclassified Nodularia (in: cyanobacteria)]|uniref:glutathione S-transferase family protein n=1 Tax=unclassified Nodularia (in: cyanobacteria) TaxID=2656917 RepID=UPI00187F9FC5|nr:MULTISPECIES: glutathione S-transferase family protein [unclassified Nodularia (in: cyanobacteria)]MBE9201176.1 glutathione S-transferase family protein [Nodularia sp. LEGE 06071]MCC2693725.1 glutathione S-transferase family protein [Nodularia sp. LEGE 04288]
MLKLYYNPISINCRRVWIALLEKKLEFDLVEMKLDGDQLQQEFLAINPLHHIPVLVDDGFNVVESLAILDYLEAKSPTSPLLPTDAKNLAIARMVEMVTVNELMPAMNPLIYQMMGFAGGEDSQKLEQAKHQLAKVLPFLENLLGDRPYFGSDQLTLADIVAGCAVPWLPTLGFPLIDYQKLSAWTERLMARSSWQKTQPTPEMIAAYKSQKQALAAKR